MMMTFDNDEKNIICTEMPDTKLSTGPMQWPQHCVAAFVVTHPVGKEKSGTKLMLIVTARSVYNIKRPNEQF